MENDYSVDNTNRKKSFLNHVFDTSEESKGEILNVMQYSLLGIIPIVILNKVTQKIFPDPDETKSSLEISFEIVMQLLLILVGIVLIHRIIIYIPTYSGFVYDSFGFINMILAFLVIVLSLQTKIGLKTNILFSRTMDLWNGTTGMGSDTTSSQSKYYSSNSSNTGGGGSDRGSFSMPSLNVENAGFGGILNTDPSSVPNAKSREPFVGSNSSSSSSYIPPMPQDPVPANFAGVSFGNF